MARIKTLAPRLARAEPARGGWSAPHRGSRHERGYGTAWEKLRDRVLDRDAGLCQPCRRRGAMTPGCRTVDHRVPKARGGADDEANCQCICDLCHKAKTQAEAQGREWDEAEANR
nr:HNH endonuclease [uncultured Roseateles sp.]